MKLLLEIKDEDIGKKTKPGKLEIREAARAIAFKDGKIAFIHVSNNGYYKLPGGGLEHGENIRSALRREMLEETGCKIKILSAVGRVIEHRTHIGVLQTSYCFIADVTSIGEPNLDAGELKAGYKLSWVALDDAIKTLKKAKPRTKVKMENYMGKFIVKRDLAFIKEAQAIMRC